ncbi:MAG: DUF501 domain-containing protein [Synergistetes bacterium]|nr:DUF501 domain-containing protein [Synergistota bacterium]
MCRGGKDYFKDLEIVRYQLKRKISGFLGVAKRCRWGYPQVIKCFPMLGGKPFPTLYWLTCPFLREGISVLESLGKIEDFHNLVLSDLELRRALKLAHKRYAEERFSLLGKGIKRYLSEKWPSYIQVIRESGIGGVGKPNGIKCLHAHFAYWLAGGETPIGKLVEKCLGNLECLDSPKCAMIEFRLQSRYNGKGGKGRDGLRYH